VPATPVAPSWIWWVGGVGVIGVIFLAVAWFATQQTAVVSPQKTMQPGAVNACRSVPRFATVAGYTTVNFATDDRAILGLKMVDVNDVTKVYRHPSWAMAGSLGPVLADGAGNVYVGPVPRINLIDNPPGQQNRIYRVDTNTGVMAAFVELPAAGPTTIENPYGVLGLAIDCETNSLYVSSVAGSDRITERGRIFRIDLNTGKVATWYEGVDAIGIGVFKTQHGKRLYFGPARSSEIRSVGLDAQGNFGHDERVEAALTAPSASGSDRARRITFTDQGAMIVNGRQFDYNLVANTYQPKLQYTFRYRLKDDGWDFVSFQAN
jgi:hypothetical protein